MTSIFKCVRRLIMERVTPKEKLDPTPIHIPGMEKPLGLKEEMQRFIRQEISRAAVANSSAGSFEEEDDFEDEEDNYDLLSQYTVIDLHPEADGYGLNGKDEKSTTGKNGAKEDGIPAEAGPDIDAGKNDDEELGRVAQAGP